MRNRILSLLAILALCSTGAYAQMSVTGSINASQITSGTVGITFLPTGTTGTTVAIGNDSRFLNATSLNSTSILSMSGLLKLTSGTPSVAASTDITGLFTGTCDTSHFLTGGGTCASAGAGSVTSVSFTGGLISVATPTSTPAFTVAGTSGGIPYFASATTWASSAALTQYGVVLGGGAGASPTATAADTTTTHAFFATATAPAFRAIAPGDIPILNQSTTGTAANITGVAAVANGGTGTASTLTGLMRGSATSMTAAELSGDVTTSGSNAATVVKVNGGTVPASAHVIGTNSSNQPIAATAADLSAISYVAGGGTAQAQTATLAPAVAALANGLEVQWLPSTANTGAAPTLAVNGLAAKPITKTGTAALVANDLTTTAIAYAIYDGTEWQLQNPQTTAATGTVTTFSAGTLSPLFTTSVATPGSTPALTFTLSTASAHAFFGNNTGSTAAPAFVQPAFTDISGSVTAAQIPNPTGSTLGGVQSATAPTNNFMTGISTSGVPAFAQPAFSNLSGSATATQLPTASPIWNTYTVS